MILKILAMVILICFAGWGVWFISDGWYSLLVHWKRDGQTIKRDHIFRFIRAFGGLFIFLGSAFILVWGFIGG